MRRSLIAILSLVIALSFAVGQTAIADGCDYEGCYVDVYAEKGMAGDSTRICGVAKLKSLDDIDGKNWTDNIQSLVVGWGADWLEIYDEPGLKKSIKVVLRDEEVPDTGGTIASLDLRCK